MLAGFRLDSGEHDIQVLDAIRGPKNIVWLIRDNSDDSLKVMKFFGTFDHKTSGRVLRIENGEEGEDSDPEFHNCIRNYGDLRDLSERGVIPRLIGRGEMSGLKYVAFDFPYEGIKFPSNLLDVKAAVKARDEDFKIFFPKKSRRRLYDSTRSTVGELHKRGYYLGDVSLLNMIVHSHNPFSGVVLDLDRAVNLKTDFGEVSEFLERRILDTLGYPFYASPENSTTVLRANFPGLYDLYRDKIQSHAYSRNRERALGSIEEIEISHLVDAIRLVKDGEVRGTLMERFREDPYLLLNRDIHALGRGETEFVSGDEEITNTALVVYEKLVSRFGEVGRELEDEVKYASGGLMAVCVLVGLDLAA